MEDRDASVGILLGRAERGHTHGKQRPPSICKVSRVLRDLSVRLFIPQLVSIGPIHKENKKLKEFERQKELYLDDLLNRCNTTPKETLEACLQKVNDLIPQIKECYAGVKNYSDDSELARMMVMDGCFILEFCFKHEQVDLDLPNKMQTFRIAMDLVLLENQVPFFVLQALFDCSMGEVEFTLSDVLDTYLAPYIKVFHSLLPENNSTTHVDSNSTHDHVLGYLHKCYQPVVIAKSSKDEERKENIIYHSIVDLDRSGMKFKPHQEDEWSMTIKFQPPLFHWFWRPTLLMPILLIDDNTELILRNFIAYEQSFPQDCNYFSSYAHAMDMLINTQEDIAKLAKSNVLANSLGSNQEAADMINKIGRNISVNARDSNYTEVFKQMDKHHKGRFCPKNMASLQRAYFNNPWNFLALLGALILFGLTVTQTIYTIRAA